MDETNTASSDSAAPVLVPAFDMATILAQMAEIQAEREMANRANRAAMLDVLRAAGIEEVRARYDAYGDSGNVEDVVLLPALEQPEASTSATDGELPFDDSDPRLELAQSTRLGDLLWSIVYALHPGFENNEGGYGEVIWDVATDAISIEHNERYIEVNSYSHEGV